MKISVINKLSTTRPHTYGQPVKKIFNRNKNYMFIPLDFSNHIDIDEAKLFANIYFGISRYNVNDLKAANRLNRTLTQLYNFTQGRMKYPPEITVTPKRKTRYVGDCGIDDITVVGDKQLEQTVIHELAHYNHSLQKGIEFGLLGKAAEIVEYKDDKVSPQDFRTFDYFRHNKALQKEVKKGISSYGTSSPAEFVAETFRKVFNNKKISQKILDAYESYGGPFLDIIKKNMIYSR